MTMAPLMILFFLAASSFSVSIVTSQSIPLCAQSLVPCLTNNTSPPMSCCHVLKETIENELPCLCKLYNATNFFSSLDDNNQTDALNSLLDGCGISVGSCSNNAIAPSSQQPPATPSNNGNFLGGVSWTPTCTMVLFWLSFMFQ